jgi:preprotein translocase subunit SecD
MNRYPLWKYLTILVALWIATIYTLPNFFGEAPAVQVSAGKATTKVDHSMVTRMEQVLAEHQLVAEAIQFDGHSVKARFASTDAQIKARDAIDHALNGDPADPTHVVALNLLPRTPAWLQALHAAPMYLGLDLRGGVHFMLQVDMPAALTKHAEAVAGDARTTLRDKNIRAMVRRAGCRIFEQCQQPAWGTVP